jgi:hypothetical protein
MTSRPPLEFLRTDADGFAKNTKRSIVVLEISRKEIDTCNFTSALERLMIMADSRENVLLYKESMVFHMQGYDADHRELSEIPEVREFFAKLSDQWPHWFWFLNRDHGSLGLLLSLLCQVKIHRANGEFGVEFLDTAEMQMRVDDLLDRGTALFDAFDIAPSEADASAKSALLALFG